MCSLVGYFKKINTFLVYSICFHKTVHNKWCLDKTLGKISKRLRPRPNVELFTTRIKVCWVRRRTWDASNQSTESDQKTILAEQGYAFSYKFLISSLVRIRRMWRSTFQPGDVLSVWGRRVERGRVVSASDSHSGGPGFCELTVSKYLSGVPVN